MNVMLPLRCAYHYTRHSATTPMASTGDLPVSACDSADRAGPR